MNTDAIVTDIILGGIGLVVAYVGRAASAWFAAHVSVANQALIGQVAEVAVHASQQLFNIGAIKDRKEHATSIVNAELVKAGIDLTAQQVSDAIEAAVHAELKLPSALAIPAVLVEPDPEPVQAPRTPLPSMGTR